VERGIALPFRDLGARRGLVVSITPPPLYPRKVPEAIVQEAGWAPGPFWTSVKNLALRVSIPRPSSPKPVAIPTELPGPHQPGYVVQSSD
jgi:hypothetical protein